MSRFKFVDLFCGIGGFRLVGERNGGECVLSCDINKDICKIYEDNFGENPYGDIYDIDFTKLDFDVIFAGFPCQPFSTMGNKKGRLDDRGILINRVFEIMDSNKPKLVFLENVRGLLYSENGAFLEYILETLDKLGYKTFWKVMNAKDYGIPQSRDRWYCVCIRKDLVNDKFKFKFPNKKEPKYVKDILDTVEEYNKKLNTNLSDDEFKELTKLTDYRHNVVKNKFEEWIIKKLKRDENFKCPEQIVGYKITPNYSNFKIDGVSPCLITSCDTFNILINTKDNKFIDCRYFTINEIRKLMTFPDEFKIKNNRKYYFGFGNSIVVNLVSEIFSEVLEQTNIFED